LLLLLFIGFQLFDKKFTIKVTHENGKFIPMSLRWFDKSGTVQPGPYFRKGGPEDPIWYN
jgi:hypothetical protein